MLNSVMAAWLKEMVHVIQSKLNKVNNDDDHNNSDNKVDHQKNNTDLLLWAGWKWFCDCH